MRDRTFEADAVRRAAVKQALADALSGEADVVFAYLHGSFVASQRFHDIDVAVYLDDEPADQTRRVVDLSERLSRRIGFPADVRALNAAPVPFAFKALQGELLVCRDDARLADVLERTGRRYLDIAPVLRQATRDAFVR